MTIITLILLLAGFVSFVIAIRWPPARINLMALGLACWILVPLIGAFAAVL